jgi:fibronectin type 3 domain-containing protein
LEIEKNQYFVHLLKKIKRIFIFIGNYLTNMKKLILFSSLLISSQIVMAQEFIFNLMERRDMRLEEIEKLADDHFKKVGIDRGTGNKQFQRWLFEQKFHVDNKGYLLPPDYDWKEYRQHKAQSLSQDASGTWVEMGPKSWNRTSGWNPGVGRITSVAVNPFDTLIIYVSSPGGGIWKSTTGGNSWTPLVDHNSSWMNVYNLCIDPNSPSTIYAALTSGGVIKSTNSGATWFTTGSGPSSTRKVLVQPGNGSIVFATANNGIWRSTNGGTNWTQVQNTSKEDIEFKPGDVSFMYASGSSSNNSVWRSTDNGLTWTVLTSTQGITNSGRTLLAVSPANPDLVYAVQASGSVFGRMYRSLNSGQTFETTVIGNASQGTNYFGYETNGTGTTGQATYDMAICVNPENANEVHIGGIICWRSTNGGFSFSPTTAWSLPNSIGYNHADVHALEWVNKTIYSGSDGGIYKRPLGATTWTELSNGLGIRQFYRMANSKTNPNVFQGGAQDNGTSLYRATGTWVDWLGADGMDCLISPTNESLVWGTSQYGTFYRSTTQGSSYSNLGKPSNGQWVTPLAIEANTNVIYGGWTGVYRSTDNGTTWTNLSTNVITTTLACLAVAPTNPQYIYASTGTSLWVTTNGGGNWTNYTAPATITSIEVSPTLPEKVWITTSNTTNKVMVSTNAGASFTNISGNLPNMAGRSIKVDATNEGLYVGMNIGVYYKDSTMTQWVDLSGNLPKVAVNEVEIQKSGGKLRVATYGRGIWETALYVSAPACEIPANLTTSNITTTSATLNWGAVSGASGYNVQYRAAGTTNYTTINNIGQNSFNLTGLQQSTSYEWMVQAICSQGNSAFSTMAVFSTLADPCPVPTGITASAITTTSASITWSPVANALSYQLQYKASADNQFTVIEGLTSTSYNFTALTQSTTYQYQVKAVCNQGQSNFSALQSFTTASPSCNPPTGLTASATGTTSTLSWNPVGGAAYYYVRYKRNNDKNWTTTAQFTATNYLITGLSTKTNYTAEVWVVCSNGLTANTSVTFRTANNGPQAPGMITYNENEVLIAPNPAVNVLHVVLAEGLTTPGSVLQVYDTYGRLLRTVPVRGVNNEINISNLPRGSYRLRWSGKDKSITQPFIKE